MDFNDRDAKERVLVSFLFVTLHTATETQGQFEVDEEALFLDVVVNIM